ncbi:MAG: AAA family ATPase, partial [Mycolicibacter algericus]
MPIRWNVPEHSAALHRLTEALDAAGVRAGAVVLGPDGCGKSTLARLAAEDRARRHPTTRIRWVIGTPAERTVPFGALSHLIRVADIGKPAALLRAARESLAEEARDGGELLLVVDDAHQLDILSATLVYQLALTGAARMIITGCADAAPIAAPPVAALWGDELLARIDIAAPDEVTQAGHDVANIEAFVAELPAPARAVLDYLAVIEPLPLADLTQLTSAGAVGQAEELGAVEIRSRGGHGPDPVVYTAHPLFGERARGA